MHAVGVIADIVDSRELTDRPAAQQAILDAFDQAESAVDPLRSAWATVGDEFQLICPTWHDAVRTTLRVKVALPDGLFLRFGLGLGEIRDVAAGSDGPIQDGSAWLNARAAVEQAHQRQERRDEVLSWFVSDGGGWDAAVNTHLLLRDHVVARLKARERRVFAALLNGATQQEAATSERISQGAVSQLLHRSGAMALLEADDEMAEIVRTSEEGRA